jgi:hypothetical protein
VRAPPVHPGVMMMIMMMVMMIDDDDGDDDDHRHESATPSRPCPSYSCTG